MAKQPFEATGPGKGKKSKEMLSVKTANPRTNERNSMLNRRGGVKAVKGMKKGGKAK
jgi:hypothetical protein